MNVARDCIAHSNCRLINIESLDDRFEPCSLDISLFDRLTLGTTSFPSGVSKVREPVARFIGIQLLQHTARKAATAANSDCRTRLIANLGVVGRGAGYPSHAFAKPAQGTKG